ncbi:TetR/AcrR family transcriptional regulator [Mycolicibacterium vulneris]|jgi:AcrR family transcriptional regulator|uniref:TetR/AcrR family transcriptional regulator n=1 Tax=Mycolicibacterium vulneris TaxID=547163 RepID=UPI001FE4238B|nr:TetR/AcrR family transcriptional regulator [Mycolicibacterium vulneris]
MAVDRQRSNKAVQKILTGTMKALNRKGTQKLSVSDICAASQVARGTFYRYFDSKDDVLRHLRRHFEEGAAEAFAKAIAATPDPSSRVKVVMDTLTGYNAAGADLTRMLDVAPEFTLSLIRDIFPNLIDLVVEALGPATHESPLVMSGALTERQLADLFLRSVISTLLLPGSQQDEVPAVVTALFAASPNSTQARPAAATST